MEEKQDRVHTSCSSPSLWWLDLAIRQQALYLALLWSARHSRRSAGTRLPFSLRFSPNSSFVVVVDEKKENQPIQENHGNMNRSGSFLIIFAITRLLTRFSNDLFFIFLCYSTQGLRYGQQKSIYESCRAVWYWNSDEFSFHVVNRRNGVEVSSRTRSTAFSTTWKSASCSFRHWSSSSRTIRRCIFVSSVDSPLFDRYVTLYCFNYLAGCILKSSKYRKLYWIDLMTWLVGLTFLISSHSWSALLCRRWSVLMSERIYLTELLIK